MSQELQAKDKMQVTDQAEQTRPRPVFIPSVDIFESEDSLTLLADMPGVEKEGLSIDLKDDTLSILGEVKPPVEEARSYLHREYNVGDYSRRFSLSSQIDQNRISASLKDGVLTLVLPKVEKAKPRQIEVRAV